MKETHLAIASVPCQQWGPLYDDGKALRQGTIFQELDLPFYVTEGIPEGQCAQKENSSQLLCQIQQISFVLDDLTLYLDMHSEDGQALALYQ